MGPVTGKAATGKPDAMASKMTRPNVSAIEPAATKIHLAGWNGYDDPLDVFLVGRFAEWQSHQSQRNFKRPFVLSLIKTEQRDRWLFGRFHRVEGPAARVAN